jgi:hypothetical protein
LAAVRIATIKEDTGLAYWLIIPRKIWEFADQEPKSWKFSDYLKGLLHQFEFGFKWYGWIDHNKEKTADDF